MALARKIEPPLDFATFAEMIRPKPDHERWELIEGKAVLMAPPNFGHQRLLMNLLRKIDALATAKGCLAFPGLGIASSHADDFATIPDIVVKCGGPIEGRYFDDPVLIAEILSPSTMAKDRGLKLAFHQGIASLQTILLVYADEPRVEHWRREGDDWTYEVASGPAGKVVLKTLGGDVTLRDIYDGVSFPTARAKRPRA